MKGFSDRDFLEGRSLYKTKHKTNLRSLLFTMKLTSEVILIETDFLTVLKIAEKLLQILLPVFDSFKQNFTFPSKTWGEILE